MALTRLLFLVTCIGGALSCLTDQRCADMHTEAMAALATNDLATFCKLRSKSIACYSSDSYDCANPEASMAPMYTGYYNTCSLSAATVNTCKQKSFSCSSHLQAAMTHLQSSDIPSYCSAMTPYLTCVNNSMSSCDSKVTIYDVLGGVQTTYDRFCSSATSADKTAACQVLIYKAGCQDSLTNITDVLTNMDFTLYCSKMDEYMACLDNTLKDCDKSVTKESILGGMSQGYQQYCAGTGTDGSGNPVQVCQTKAYRCYPTLTAAMNNTGNSAGMCSAYRDYISCVKQVMKNCDSSVKLSDVVGKLEGNYNVICGVTATGGYCPAVATCMQPMTMGSSTPSQQPSGGEDGQGQQPDMAPQTPNIIQDCSKPATLITCFGTELSSCNYTSPRNYGFKDVSTLFVTGCKTLGTDTDLMTCSQMTTCMNTYKFPTDIKEVGRLYYDPQFWCSFLKSTIVCAEGADQCQSDRSKYTALLNDVNQVCPEAKVLVTLSGSAVSRAGILSVLSAISVTLLSIQL